LATSGILLRNIGTTTMESLTEQEQRRHIRRLAKKRVQWLIEHSTSYQILCWIDSLVLRNPLLRQASNTLYVTLKEYDSEHYRHSK